MTQHMKIYYNTKNKLRIFQIGFNKCGTRSLFHFFKDNNISSIHYDGGKIANSMLRHYNNNEPMIDIRYKNTCFFSDMENIFRKKPLYIGLLFFKELSYDYPNSIFILNIRDKNNWLKSRCLHKKGDYLKDTSSKLNLSEEEVIKLWSNQWDTHINNVKIFFKDKPNRLIIFDIETDPINKLVSFFQPLLKLNPNKYKHYGKTNI